MIEVCTAKEQKTADTPLGACHMVSRRDDGNLDVGISDGEKRFDFIMQPEAAMLFAASLFRAFPPIRRENFYNFVFPKLSGELSETGGARE